jgi:hypothetical protein
MNIDLVLFDGDFGSAAARLLKATATARPLPPPGHWLEPAPGVQTTGALIILRGPVFSRLLDFGNRMGSVAWVAALPFERHILVTPVFGPGRPCPRCFVRRWASQPPDGYHPEVVSAIDTVVSSTDDFEYRNISPLAATLVSEALLDSARRDASYALCIDQAGESVLSTPLRPLHGCACRGAGGGNPERFAQFDDSLKALLFSRVTPSVPLSQKKGVSC